MTGVGYACPVCATPQIDGEHLANHLAFTALLGDASHETWLDDHVPDWESTDPETLARWVVSDAPAADFPQVFEDTVSESGDGADSQPPVPRRSARATDATVAEVMARARELTARRYGSEDATQSSETETE